MQAAVDLHDSSRALADAAAIQAVLDGDTQRFAELVTRYQAALYRHAVSMVLDHAAAADMVQDAFVRAFTNLAACRDRMRFRAWLFQTLRNGCLDYLKDARRRSVPIDDAGPLVDGADGPATLVDRARFRRAVAQALAQLPHPQREAFVMHYVEGLPYEAMADLLDASVSALKMRVLRARAALATALRHHDVTESQPARLHYRRG